jgi:hypothetical protein
VQSSRYNLVGSADSTLSGSSDGGAANVSAGVTLFSAGGADADGHRPRQQDQRQHREDAGEPGAGKKAGEAESPGDGWLLGIESRLNRCRYQDRP